MNDVAGHGVRRLWPRATVWNRLLLTITGIILIVWLVLAVSILFFLKAQREYSVIASEQIPALAAVNTLAEYSARLSTIATEIFGQRLGPEEPVGVELSELVEELTSSLAPIAQTSRAADAPEIVHRVTRQLAGIQSMQEAVTRSEREMETQLNILRWLNADVQGEVDPLLNDFAFNISVAMSSMVRSSDPGFRSRQAVLIEKEARQRDTVRRLGDGAANTVTLIFQGAVTDNVHRLEQLRDLTDDGLQRMDRLVEQLPDKPELTTLRQSIVALMPVANSTGGIFQLRQTWLESQAEILTSLATLQGDLSALQAVLSAIGADQRERILAETKRSMQETGLAIRWLVGLTLLAALIGAGALFGYVRTGIVRPLRRMTRRLGDIAQAQNLQVQPSREEDEIGQLSLAISEFERSIETRDLALESLKQTQKELIQAGKMAALGQMSAGIAHELNQPLAAMQHRLGLLEGYAVEGDADMTGRQIARLNGLIDRMTRTITYLRNFARRSEFSEDRLFLDELVTDSLALLQARIVAEDVRMDVSKGLARLWVIGDKILIEQVLVNILSNALDAIQQAERPGEIRIAARVHQDQVHLTVTDNGSGFDLISPTGALDPFVTTKDVGKGLGLGLSISYNIMKDLQGDLLLAPNSDGPGAAATLVLRGGSKQDDGADLRGG